MTRTPHRGPPGSSGPGRAPSRPGARGASRPAKPAGPSQRQLRVGELIRRTLSEILASGELHDPGLEGVLVTVGEVRVSPDLKQATAFVLPLGGANGPALIEALARARPGLRHLLGRAMTLRHVPDLRFRLDDTFDRIDATRRLFEDERVRRDLEASEPENAEPESDEPESDKPESDADPDDGGPEPEGEGGAR